MSVMDLTIGELTEAGAWERQVRIDVPAAVVAGATDTELKKLRRQVSVPGFRKGKVPMGELRQRFGKEVEFEVLERVMGEAVGQAVQRYALHVLGAPRIESVEYEPDQPLSFTAVFDVLPEFDLPDYKGVAVDKLARPITDADVDRLLENLRQEQAEITPVDRPAARGDVVRAAATQLGPGQVELIGEQAQELRILLAEDTAPAAWLEALTGRARGDTATVAVAAAETEAGGQPPETPPGYVKLQVQEVMERQLPELDDAFAQSLADLPTIEALRQRLRERLEAEEDRRATRLLEDQLIERLAEPLHLDIPERLIREPADELFERALSRAGDMAETDRERLAVEAKAEATRRLRREILLDAIATAENLKVGHQEAESAYANLVNAGYDVDVKPDSKERVLESLRGSLRDRKVLNLLVEHADVRVIEQSRGGRRIVTPFDE